MFRFLALLNGCVFATVIVMCILRNEPVPNGAWHILIVGFLAYILDRLESIEKQISKVWTYQITYIPKKEKDND